MSFCRKLSLSKFDQLFLVHSFTRKLNHTMPPFGKSTMVRICASLWLYACVNRYKPPLCLQFSFQLGFFCLAVALSVALADDDLDFDVRGPAGLKKCQDLIEKNKGLLKACKKSGRKIRSANFYNKCFIQGILQI